MLLAAKSGIFVSNKIYASPSPIQFVFKSNNKCKSVSKMVVPVIPRNLCKKKKNCPAPSILNLNWSWKVP